MHSRTYLALLLVSFVACKEETFVEIVPKPPPVSIVRVEPNLVLAGTIMKVIFKRESDSISLSTAYEMNGATYSAKRVHGDTLFVIFPYIIRFTGMTVFAYDERTATRYPLEVDFLPQPELCRDSPVCVRWSNIDPITQSYPYYDWTVNISDDTVYLQASSIYPDSEFHIYLTFLNQGTANLPRFLSYTTDSRPWFFRDTLQNGLIKIDQWNPNGILSGVVFASELNNIRLWQSPPTYFYVTVP